MPAHLPASSETVSGVISRLTAAEGAGPALGRVVSMLAAAAQNGVVPASPQAVAAVVAWLVGPSPTPGRWKERLRATDSAPPESILLRLLLGEDAGELTAELQATPEQVLAELAADEGLRASADQLGRGEEWEAALSELMARNDGDRLVALHGLASPYRFVDLPVEGSAGWRRAQVHLLAGPGGAGTVVVDIHTPNLGDVWMSLSIVGDSGRLKVQSTTDDGRAAFERARPTLIESLAQGGFGDIQVDVEPWDGDRLAAAAALFGAYRSVEVDA